MTLIRRTYLAIVAVLGLFALAACGSSGSSGQAGTTAAQPTTSAAPTDTSSAATSASALPAAAGSITVGSAAFPENELLADIYGDAMAAKGVKVTKKLNIGERGVYIAALKDGSIGFVPEYTGSILTYLDPKADAKKPEDVYAALQKLAPTQGFAVAQYAQAQDGDTVTVTKGTASKYHLKSIGDLAAVAKNLTYGGPAQQKTRADGLPLIAAQYGVTFGRFTPTDAGGTVTVTALKNGTIDAADIFSTDPAIATNGFVILADPKGIYPAQNIVPMFAQKALTQPMRDAVDAVSAKLDTKTLGQLVAKVVTDKQDAEAVAKAWLKQNSLG